MSEERFWNTDESISTAKFAVPDGVKAESSKILWEHLRKPISLILNLLYDAGYIVLRMPLCGFQKIKNFIPIDPLIIAGVHINDAVCLRVFRNHAVVGNEKEVIFQEVVAVFTRDIFHIHDTLGGHISETLIVPAVHIPFRQILCLDFRRVDSMCKQISIFILYILMPMITQDDLFFSIEIASEFLHTNLL